MPGEVAPEDGDQREGDLSVAAGETGLEGVGDDWWRVFVCYRQSDGKRAAQLINDAISGQRLALPPTGVRHRPMVDVYFDQEAPAVGRWDEYHLEALEKAQSFVVICSPGAAIRFGRDQRPQDWVHEELDWWLKNRSIPPIIIITAGPEFIPRDLRKRWPKAQQVALDPDTLARPEGPEYAKLVAVVRERVLAGIVADSPEVVREKLAQQEQRNRALVRQGRRLVFAVIVAGIAALFAGWQWYEAGSSRVAAEDARDLAETNQVIAEANAALAEERGTLYRRQLGETAVILAAQPSTRVDALRLVVSAVGDFEANIAEPPIAFTELTNVTARFSASQTIPASRSGAIFSDNHGNLWTQDDLGVTAHLAASGFASANRYGFARQLTDYTAPLDVRDTSEDGFTLVLTGGGFVNSQLIVLDVRSGTETLFLEYPMLRVDTEALFAQGYNNITLGVSSISALNRSGQLLAATAPSSRVQYDEFAPNGDRRLAVGAQQVQIWDLAARAIVSSIDIPDSIVTDLGFSPSGGLLAIGDAHGRILIWSNRSARVISILHHWDSTEAVSLAAGVAAEKAVSSVRFSDDGLTLFAVFADGVVAGWSLADTDDSVTRPRFSVNLRAQGEDTTGLSFRVCSNSRAVVWGPDGLDFWRWDDDSSRLHHDWMAAAWTPIEADVGAVSTLDAPVAGEIVAVECSMDGNFIAAATSEITYIWDLRSGYLVSTQRWPEYGIDDLAFSLNAEELSLGVLGRAGAAVVFIRRSGFMNVFSGPSYRGEEVSRRSETWPGESNFIQSINAVYRLPVGDRLLIATRFGGQFIVDYGGASVEMIDNYQPTEFYADVGLSRTDDSITYATGAMLRL